jgi:CDP-diacylglycerol---glycerol-3-phosphate 3-phosphatidyltransferase
MDNKIWNVPNTLSTLRLILACVVCGLIEWHAYLAATICFLIAASTDWVDGWYARKYQQVTKLGRILDPFVDKVIIIGSMIALCPQSSVGGAPNSGLAPWMVTVVVARELLVTSLRGMIEGAGGDFSAKQLGKWKMLLQCAAIVAVLLSLMQSPLAPWLYWSRTILVWSAILLTIVSGLEYVWLVVRPAKASE